jgi:hypothetical protein
MKIRRIDHRTRQLGWSLAGLVLFAIGVLWLVLDSTKTPAAEMTQQPLISQASSNPDQSLTPVRYAGTIYYVDCSASVNGDGSQETPWNNLDTINAQTFLAGNQILFKRGATCTGQLWPKGSGVSGNPIIISAYGAGARPIIDGNNAVAPVVTIKDQSYWTFDSLEIKNSTGLGFYVDGSPGADLHGFTLMNLYVHDGGLNDGQHLILLGQYNHHSVHDVLLDNVEASFGWRGIEIGGKCCNNPAIRSTNIVIRNSTVHDVQSDGILVASTNNALVEHCVVYNTGIMTILQNHKPNGLWTWDCDDCTIQFNEVYESHSPSEDGGAFDIDYYSHRNIIQYNYGHDSDGYCVAVFGSASDDITTSNVIRFNICSNDGRSETGHSGIYIIAKKGGKVQDTQIYNNTIYWNPANLINQYAILVTSLTDSQAIRNTNIFNNLIYSTSPSLVSIEADPAQQNLDYNLFWYIGSDRPRYKLGDGYFNGLSEWQVGTGKDIHSLFADPLLLDPTYHGIGFPTTSFMLQTGSPAIDAGTNLVALGLILDTGGHDFFGNPIPISAYDIGAYEHP